MNMAKKSFWDRLESKQFTINLISFFGIILVGIIVIILIIMGTIDKAIIQNIIYWIIGLVSGLLGGRAIQNDKN
jgi:phosphatidylglycerophosphate synthase